LFDELMARLDDRDARDQLLLVPEIFEGSPSDTALLLDHADALRAVGLGVEPFGHAAVALRSVPLPLRRLRPADVLVEVLGILRDGGSAPTRASIVADVVAGLACKAAVKFGDRLPDAEVAALVRHEIDHPEARNCPHGRNTALEISLKDLEFRFQRKK
jgi:DNA mismatch repair protein MutL